MLAISFWVAPMASHRGSDRTKTGLERARANDERIGRQPGVRAGRKVRRSVCLSRWVHERDARKTDPWWALGQR